MAQVAANGIALEYELGGPEDGRPLLMIHGVGAQLVRWPGALLDALHGAGFRTVRFDNRDVGLSTHMDGGAAYTLADMAADALGLMDALGIGAAHLLGVSLGGMIAQAAAIARPERVASLAVFMSHTGNPALPPSEPAALAALSTPAPDPAADREAYLRHSVALNRALGSPLYPTEEAELRRLAGLAAARAYDPAGAARQLAASRSAPDRRAGLATLACPTLVVHGACDPLILPAGGEDIARTVPGAWLMTVGGMGHDLPDPLCPMFAALVAANADRAKSERSAPAK